MTKQRRTSKELQRLLPILETTKAALAKLPGYVGIVYRGADILPEEFLAQHSIGAVITYTAFPSCSGDARATFGCRYRFVIQAHGGAKDVSLLSAHKQEAECLYPPDAHFLVLGVAQCGQALMFFLQAHQVQDAPAKEDDATVLGRVPVGCG